MHSFIQRALAMIVVVSVVVVMPAVRANHHEHKDHKDHQGSAASSSSGEISTGLINGEVRRIDTENRKLTIKHEAIPELDMVAMTMVFGVVDTVVLDQLKAGDMIRFSLKKSEGKWRVMTIQSEEMP